jgi:ketosteroid isomerase-like protein
MGLSPEEVVKGGFARLADGDRDGLVAMFTPETELHSRLAEMRGEPYVGQDGLHQWFADIDDQFSEFSLAVENIEAVGEGRVYAEALVEMRGRSSNLPWKEELTWVITIAGESILRLEIFTDREAARKAAGLDER